MAAGLGAVTDYPTRSGFGPQHSLGLTNCYVLPAGKNAIVRNPRLSCIALRSRRFAKRGETGPINKKIESNPIVRSYRAVSQTCYLSHVSGIFSGELDFQLSVKTGQLHVHDLSLHRTDSAGETQAACEKNTLNTTYKTMTRHWEEGLLSLIALSPRVALSYNTCTPQ